MNCFHYLWPSVSFISAQELKLESELLNYKESNAVGQEGTLKYLQWKSRIRWTVLKAFLILQLFLTFQLMNLVGIAFYKAHWVFQQKENKPFASQVSQNVTGDLFFLFLTVHNTSAIPSGFTYQIYPEYKFLLLFLFPLCLKPSLSFCLAYCNDSQLVFLPLLLYPHPSSATVLSSTQWLELVYSTRKYKLAPLFKSLQWFPMSLRIKVKVTHMCYEALCYMCIPR